MTTTSQLTTLLGERLRAHPLAQDVTERRLARVAAVAAARLSSVTVVLENLADAHNASAVLRSAEALGLASMHVVEQPNKWEKNRAITMGADRWVEVVKHDGLARCLGNLSAQGFSLWAADVGDGCVPLHDIPVSGKVALLFGSERDGLSKRARALTDGRFTIPMYGFVESFNVSVSAAVSLYDVSSRRRRTLGDAADFDVDAAYDVAVGYLIRAVRNPRIVEQRLGSQTGV